MIFYNNEGSFNMSGTSSNPADLAPKTVANLGAGLAKALAKSQSGKQESHPISLPRATGGGAAFVKSSTNGAVASSPPSPPLPTQSGSQGPSARGGGVDGHVCDCKKCVAERVGNAGPPPLSPEFLNVFRPEKLSAEEEKQRKRAEILARVEAARKKQAKEKAAEAMMTQVTTALKILELRRQSPALLRRNILFTINIHEGSDRERLFIVLDLFRDILRLVGGQLLQSASAICPCNLCQVRFFMRIFHPNPVPDPELELARLFWRRAFEISDFPQIAGMIFHFLEEQLQILEISRRLYMLFEELGGNGGHQDPPPRAPKAMPPITSASAASPFEPCTHDCVICMGPLSGQCMMSQCRHALHSKCMCSLFENGINVCPFCRAPIQTLVSTTLEESPKASEDSSAGGASADALESPKASEE